jgi:cation transporter-like permease
MIANDTIVNADINSTAGIAYSKLSLGGAITSADLVDGTIVNSDINASAAIALSKLATDPLARANHTGTQTASTISDFDTQVRTSKVTDLAAPTGSFSMNSQKITSLLDPTSAQDASTKAYVDAQVNALVDGAPGTLNTLNEIATAISSGGSFESTVVLKSGSTMTGALTLSGAPTVDLHAATKAYVDTVAGSATAAAASATAAAASYDSFDDRYLGAKSSAPSVDNDGNALVEGALYWNSVSNAMLAWDGAAWASISSTADIYRYRFTAAGGETSESGVDDNGLTLSYIVGKEQVYLNGVLLVRTTDYVATNGTSISSLAALTAGDVLEIITFTAFDLANVLSPTLFDAKGDILAATSADTAGKLTLGTNGHYLKANSSTATGLEWAAVPNPDLTPYAETIMTIMGAY